MPPRDQTQQSNRVLAELTNRTQPEPSQLLTSQSSHSPPSGYAKMSAALQHFSRKSLSPKQPIPPAHAHVEMPTEPVAAAKRVSQVSTCTTNSATSTGASKHKTHVGPWRLGRTLGRGSSGRVRLAKHSKTGMLAAVKIVPKSVNLDDQSDDSSGGGGKKGKDAAGLPYGIEREVIIMKLIEHPNVLGLYDVWENTGELYLILEYVEGGELFDYLIKRGRLDENEAVHYFRQIILGVDYCHKFNICHRDLKPENLLLDKNHNIKIADFGMAALEASGKMLETSCGSPHYASPEIVAGKTYHGSPSDIWSCGIILFALLTGHLPFDDDNIRTLLMKVQTGKFQMPAELSIHAKDLIWRILKTEPEERITAEEILDHPLLRKYPPDKMTVEPFRPPITVNRPVQSYQDIDMEIVKNLQTLWHGIDKSIIIDRLLSLELNSEKTFYCLLMKYRHDHQDDYSSAENSPRSSPLYKQRTKHSTSSAKLASRGRTKPLHQTTPSKVRRHGKTASRVSVMSAGSNHKRGVDFSHTRKRSTRSTSSTPSSKSQRTDRVCIVIGGGALLTPYRRHLLLTRRLHTVGMDRRFRHRLSRRCYVETQSNQLKKVELEL
ncbi:kinase-like domain-containing protein [Lipomyces arxii]|uniref:kinase-like domain-containing protein n=1 Tax=Lipomyces arxii TaxID=56418 RepID=UPI0034CD85D7